MEQQNPPTEFSDRHKWLAKHVLIPFEDNYMVTFSERMIDSWVDFFKTNGWTQGEILRTKDVLLSTCSFLPKRAEWEKYRAKPVKYVDPNPETLEETFARLAKDGRGWGPTCAKITFDGLRKRDKDGYNMMPDAYDKLAVAAREFSRPDEEIEGFQRAKEKMLELREAARQNKLRPKSPEEPIVGWQAGSVTPDDTDDEALF